MALSHCHFPVWRCIRWRNTTDNPVRAVGKRCLVDNGIVDIRFDALFFAPVLREDMVDVDILAEEDVWSNF